MTEPILTKKQAIEIVKEFKNELLKLKPKEDGDDDVIHAWELNHTIQFLINHFKIKEGELK